MTKTKTKTNHRAAARSGIPQPGRGWPAMAVGIEAITLTIGVVCSLIYAASWVL